MNRIGVMVDSFRVGLIEGIKNAREVGAGAVQMYVKGGISSEDVWTPSYRKDAINCLKDNGLVVAAVCGDLGGHGFAKAGDNAQRIDETRRMFDLTRELGCNILTTHIGVIPSDKKHPRWSVLYDALNELSISGKDANVHIAIETGPESPETLKSFVEAIENGYVGVNYDPANLVMVLGEDPIKGVKTLAKHILHTHAKDGKLLKFVGAESIYGFFAEGGIEDLRIEDCFIETPLGQGEAKIPEWVATLNEVGYKGYLTIEREVGLDPYNDIKMAVEYLKRYL